MSEANPGIGFVPLDHPDSEIPTFVQDVIDGKAKPTPGHPCCELGKDDPLAGTWYGTRHFVTRGTTDVHDYTSHVGIAVCMMTDELLVARSLEREAV